MNTRIPAMKKDPFQFGFLRMLDGSPETARSTIAVMNNELRLYLNRDSSKPSSSFGRL
jgi:hypothetical protein